MNPFEDWTNSELANALLENEEFNKDELDHLSEEKLANIQVWSWDRSDLIAYAYDYLEPTD
jgi:hypothetical protein